MAGTRRNTLQALAAGALSMVAGRALAQDDKSPITLLMGFGAQRWTSPRG